MKHVEVLGSGCRNHEITPGAMAKAAPQAGVERELEKVTDIAMIMGYGVMSTPGVVIDAETVHTDRIRALLQVPAQKGERR